MKASGLFERFTQNRFIDIMQNGHPDAVTDFAAFGNLAELVIQAQTQNMGKSGVDRKRFIGRQAGGGAGFAQAFGGVDRALAAGQGKNPRSIDKNPAAVFFEIDAIAALAAIADFAKKAARFL